MINKYRLELDQVVDVFPDDSFDANDMVQYPKDYVFFRELHQSIDWPIHLLHHYYYRFDDENCC